MACGGKRLGPEVSDPFGPRGRGRSRCLSEKQRDRTNRPLSVVVFWADHNMWNSHSSPIIRRSDAATLAATWSGASAANDWIMGSTVTGPS